MTALALGHDEGATFAGGVDGVEGTVLTELPLVFRRKGMGLAEFPIELAGDDEQAVADFFGGFSTVEKVNDAPQNPSGCGIF